MISLKNIIKLKNNIMADKYLTKEGLERMKKDLEFLKKEERIKIAKQLEEAISFGDLSENAAYDEAKDAQAQLEGRIMELENTINSAAIIKESRKHDWVEVGSYVTVKWNGSEDTFQIVGEEEANPIQKRISHRSPLGKMLLGKPKGAKVKVVTPKGQIEYTVIKIN